MWWNRAPVATSNRPLEITNMAVGVPYISHHGKNTLSCVYEPVVVWLCGDAKNGAGFLIITECTVVTSHNTLYWPWIFGFVLVVLCLVTIKLLFNREIVIKPFTKLTKCAGMCKYSKCCMLGINVYFLGCECNCQWCDCILMWCRIHLVMVVFFNPLKFIRNRTKHFLLKSYLFKSVTFNLINQVRTWSSGLELEQ